MDANATPGGGAGQTLTIDPRFNGPPDSANGGYAAGLLARRLPGPAEVTLRRPVPLGAPLLLTGPDEDGRVVLLPADGTGGTDAVVIADAVRAADDALEGIDPPVRPSLADAEAASERHAGRRARHTMSVCIVCSPWREDGFGVCPGPLADQPEVGAAVFRPPAGLADADGALPEEIVWAALDCPSLVPEMWERAVRGEGVSLLGRMTAQVLRPVRADETLVAVGWRLGRDGRKDLTASALLTPAGELVARARAVWIALRPGPVTGA